MLQVDKYQGKEELDLGMGFSKYQALNPNMLPYLLLLELLQLHQWQLEGTLERYHVASIVMES